MTNDSYTLIISTPNKKDAQFFLIPNSKISSDQRKVLKHVCSMKLSDNLPEDEYDQLMAVKASLENKSNWFPSFIPQEWRGCFSEFKTDVPVYCPNITSVVLVN